MYLEEDYSHDGLFQIGDVAKCCGVDRQTILFYERKGLITPTSKNKSSGYRYYSVEAITELMQILQLKDMGFSLREIKDFNENNVKSTERIIVKIEEKIAALMNGLEQAKAIHIKKDDYSVTLTKLPATRCYVREYICNSIEDATNKMYEAFQDALSLRFLMRDAYRIYAEYQDETGDTVNLSNFKLRVYIPVASNTKDVNCLDIPSIHGLSLYYRGDYAEINNAYNVLWRYVKENNYTPVGAVREYYLESKKEYQNDKDRYVTRIVLPILIDTNSNH